MDDGRVGGEGGGHGLVELGEVKAAVDEEDEGFELHFWDGWMLFVGRDKGKGLVGWWK